MILSAALVYGVDIEKEKRILILFPTQSDLPAYPIVEKSIKSSLTSGTEFRIEYFIEYMDLYRNANETYNRLLLDLYHHKFTKHPIDLVIAWGAQSLNFVYTHEKDLFKQMPVVFSGVSESLHKELRLNKRTTGMFVDIDYTGMLETALKIHPQTRQVVVVNGASRSDQLIEQEIRTALASYAEQYTFTYLTGLPMREIEQRVQSLPQNTVILYYVITQDGTGKGFKPYDAAKIVAEAANVPVYGCLDSYLGSGIVGGRVISLEMTGIKAGEMARRILQGENPTNIAITSQGTTIDLFDWRQFKRFGITEDQLPPGSTVRFKEYSFWELYRNYVLLGFCIFMAQSALIAFLIYQRAQRQRTQVQLQEAEQKYRTVADFNYDWEYWINTDGSLEYVSPSCERITGYSSQEFIAAPSMIEDIIAPEDRDVFIYHRHNHDDSTNHQEVQYRIRTKDGRTRWIEHVCQNVTDSTGEPMGIRVSNRDITLRKRAESKLRDAYVDIQRLKDQLEAETTYLQEEIRLEHNFDNIIGNSAELKYVLYKVEQVAPGDTTVLILGESGTGKELIARAIHSRSPRGERPLIKVNCAALPSHLIESELFGHEKGAFTDAHSLRIGRFEIADGTSIFLDEIGELPMELQVKLLRVLQDGEFERLGSAETKKVNVRVIAATNRDLEEEVLQGRFREDLFYRLNVFPITLPPLRQRINDIPQLTKFFVENAAKRLNKKIEHIPERVVQKLQEYSWPGNVRELINIIERAVINSSGPKLQLIDTLTEKRFDNKKSTIMSLQEIEKNHILKVLEITNWRIGGDNGAAVLLEINPSTLRSRMKKLNITT